MKPEEEKNAGDGFGNDREELRGMPKYDERLAEVRRRRRAAVGAFMLKRVYLTLEKCAEDKCKKSNLPGLKTVLTGENSSDFSLEYLDNTGFVLKTTKTFDVKSKSSYTLIARLPRCNNRAEEVAVKIEILDKNDNTRLFNVTTDRIEILTDVKSRVRKPRAVSEAVSYTVTVSEDVKVGDLIFTVPDQKFEKKWFEVVSDGHSPVQIERDLGRVYLAHRLMSTAEVMVKIHNMRALESCLGQFESVLLRAEQGW
ncbi:unnamed protein product [Leuciscus chuanchicus]